jgi:N-acetylneuraminic acid mutarotase
MTFKKAYLFKVIIFLLFALSIFVSCEKETSSPLSSVANPPPPPNPLVPLLGVINCDSSRSAVNISLVPVGSLSEGRAGLVSATAGTKIVFAGGIVPGAYSSRVDIYDTITLSWSKAEFTIRERQGMAVAAIGSKIFFAGGQDADWIDVTSRVDIYDAATNTWTTAELSQPKAYLAAVTLGNKIYFAGGANWGPLTSGSPRNYFVGSNVVDIYDNSTNTWTTDKLSEGRYELSATAVGNKIYFAGGLNSIFNTSKTIDIYDATSNAWSTSQLQEPRSGHVGVVSGNKIFWVGGANSPYQLGYVLSENTEIRDLNSGLSSSVCITPKSRFSAVVKNENIIFFTGDVGSGTQFDIYNTVNGQWSTGVLNKTLKSATIISVNNTTYIAGGRGDNPWGPYYREVWKLEY